MDKARFKEVGYVLFQAFKQRNNYGEIKRFFKTSSENGLDFNEAVELVTELLLMTNKYKKLSKYLRVQLLYGLDLVKKEQEENKVNSISQDR